MTVRLHVGMIAWDCGGLGTRILAALASFPGCCITGMRLSLLSWWHEVTHGIGMQAQLLKARRDQYTLWSRVNTAVTMSLPAVPSRPPEGLESAGRLVDQHLKTDQTYVELSGQLRIATHRKSMYEVWSCRGWGIKNLKRHELASSRLCNFLFIAHLNCLSRGYSQVFCFLANHVDSYRSLSVVYSLVRDYACGQVLRTILCFSYRLRPARLHSNSLVPFIIQPLSFKFSIHRERNGLVMVQPSSCCHGRNLMWPIRSALFVDRIHCHGVQLHHVF